MRKRISVATIWEGLKTVCSLLIALLLLMPAAGAAKFVRPQAFLREQDGFVAAAFLPKTNRLVVGTDKSLLLWDFLGKKKPQILSRQLGSPINLLPTRDGTKLLVVSLHWMDTPKQGFYRTYTMRLWDVAKRKVLWSRKIEGASVTLSPDEKLIASGSFNNRVKLWDARTGKLLRVFHGKKNEHQIYSVAFSPDGKFVVGASSYDVGELGGKGELLLWRVHDGSLRHIWHDYENVIAGPVFSPDSQRIYASVAFILDATTGSCYIGAFDVRTKRMRRFESRYTANNIANPILSPDGRLLITGGGGSTYGEPDAPAYLASWDTRTFRFRKHFLAHSDVINEVTLSSDGTWLATYSDDDYLKVWPVSLLRP